MRIDREKKNVKQPGKHAAKLRKPIEYGFMVGEEDILIHVRSGLQVACFELIGVNPKTGKRAAQILAGDYDGFMGLQLTTYKDATVKARLTNGDTVPLNINPK